jgi:hypothetical protein
LTIEALHRLSGVLIYKVATLGHQNIDCASIFGQLGLRGFIF